MQRGLIFNERTGKTIKIGAATYNKLVLDGYTPDRAAGVLTPPASSRASSNGRARRTPGLRSAHPPPLDNSPSMVEACSVLQPMCMPCKVYFTVSNLCVSSDSWDLPLLQECLLRQARQGYEQTSNALPLKIC